MQEALKPIMKVQELDMQMLQLMNLKRDRQSQLKYHQSQKTKLESERQIEHGKITEIKKDIHMLESDLEEITAKIKKLEGQQSQIKKVDEFNALSQEMSQLERERVAKELKASDLYDKLTVEEDILKNLDLNLNTTVESSRVIEEEVREGIVSINEEGKKLQIEREKLAHTTDPEVLRIYERLLKNKQDRVIVPIENRTCSGCHITITAQDENLVRKGERLVFCEHCSRIHYWPESEVVEEVPGVTKTRRRRRV